MKGLQLLFLLSFNINLLSAQVELDFYSFLWNAMDITISKLEDAGFKEIEKIEGEDSVDYIFEKGDVQIKTFCYNETKDSIVEMMITTNDEFVFQTLINNNLRFDRKAFELSNELILGYDSEVYLKKKKTLNFISDN